MDFPSRLDLFAIGRDYVLQKAKKLDPQQVNIAGSDVNIYVGAISQIAYSLVLQLAFAVNNLLLDGAEEEDLDRYAFDRYQLPRKGAAAALGSIVVSRLTFAAGAGSIPTGTKLTTLSGIEYVTTTTISFGATDLTSVGDVVAVQAGKNQQAGANSIRRFSNIGILFDSTLTLNNPDPCAGGEDAEDDETFRERIRDFWNTARRGTLGAIEFGAKTLPGIFSAQAVEVLTTGAQPARVVLLYISDSSGVASKALAESVRNQLGEFRAGGIAVIVTTSVPQIVNVTLKLTFQAGVDTSTLTDSVIAAIVSFVNSLAVNAVLLKSDLSAVLVRFKQEGLVVGNDTLVSPVGDLVPDVGKSLRMNTENVKVL